MWNYRVIMFRDNLNKPYFEVSEVYYDEKGDIRGWTESHHLLIGDTPDELKETYEYMASAFEQPVLKRVGDKLVEVEE